MSTGKLKDKVQYIDRLSEDNFNLLTDNPDHTTVIMGTEEAYWTNSFNDQVTGKNLINDYIVDAINKNTFPDIKMLVCGYNYVDVPGHRDITDFTRLGHGIPWAERVNWPTYWFGYEVSLDFRYSPKQMPVDIEPRKLISCFMNSGHKPHRVMLMHSLADNNMIDSGIIRFCNSDGAWSSFTKWTKKEIAGQPHIYLPLFNKLLPHLNKIFSQNKWGLANQIGVGFDPDYHLGCIDIVSCSNVHTTTYCEKTARPLLFGKPFYLVGPSNCNNDLKNLGFELYDELFDYSLDNHVPMMSPTNTYKKYYDQMLNRVYNMEDTPEHIEHIMEITREKRMFNQKRIVDIIFDDSYIPYVFEEYQDTYSFNVAVTWPRKILANSTYFSKYLSNEQIRKYSGK